MSNNTGVHFRFSPHSPAASRSWLTFFLAALGMGVAQANVQYQLKYWWVLPEEAPEPAPQVFRVTGEKGENFEPVYNFEELVTLQNDPAVVAARAARQEALRQEAMMLVRKLRQEGKSPMVAYEEAWAQVYSSHWLNANWMAGSSKLEHMLDLLAEKGENLELTPEEQQVVLEALLEADDRLESKEGRELLRRLAARLRALGYGQLKLLLQARNNQVMQRFADALAQGMDSRVAYRDAMFKTYRDRIMTHTDWGYQAPWGLHGGEAPVYRQAPLKVTNTLGTGTGLANVAGGAILKDFLAKSPESGEQEEEKEEEKEQEDELVQQGTSAAGAAPAASSSAPAPRQSMAMRAVAPVAAAGETVPSLPQATMTELWNAADLRLTAGAEASIHVDRSPTSRYGNLSWSRVNNWSSNYQWSGGTSIKSNTVRYYDSIGLSDNNHLYLGTGNNVSIVVNGEGNYLHAEGESYSRPVAGSGLFTYNMLQGQGELTLMADKAPTTWYGQTTYYTTIYSFSGTPAEDEGFYGTLRFASSRNDASVQLNLSGEHWKNTEFDMTRGGGPGYDVTNSNAQARSVVLNLTGDTHIRGLSGGDDGSTVTSQANTQDLSPTLTLGVDGDVTYTYGGTFNRSYYVSESTVQSDSAPLNLTKVGSNTQVITQDVTSDVEGNSALDGSLNLLTVEDGTLDFRGELETSKLHALGGTLLVGGNLNVTGGESPGASTVAMQVEGPAEVQVAGTTTAYNVNVLKPTDQTSGGQFTTGNLEVERTVHVDGAGSLLTVGSSSAAGALKAQNIYVTNGGRISALGSVTATAGVSVGNGNATVDSGLTSTGAFVTSDLRLRSDAVLTTQASAVVQGDAHLHGGASWEMTGKSNSIDGVLYLESTAGNPLLLTGTGAAKEGNVVLTLPGEVDFSRSGWDGQNAVIALDGVTLDFYRGVTLTNLGFNVTEGDVLTLASGNGWVADSTPNVTVKSGIDFYHGELSDANGLVTITIKHKIDLSHEPFVVGASDIVYIEMHADAASPALPYLAYDDARYLNDQWTETDDNPVSALEVMRFHNVKLTEGAHLYLGEDAGASLADHHFGGNVVVVNNDSNVAQLHGQIGTWGKWYLDGHLGGSGDLKLIAHHSNTSGSATKPTDTATVKYTLADYGSASVFEFSNATNPQAWLNGTISLANTGGGIVQLNVGNVKIAGQGDTRWDNVVIDLTRGKYTDHAYGSNTSGTASELVLGVMGDASVAGLVGGDGSSVVSNHKVGSPVSSYTLTLGDDSSNEYKFGGTIGSGRFYSGGRAHAITTTTTITTEGEGGRPVTSTSTSTTEYNFLTSRTAGLSVTKVGSNTQSFSGAVYLDQLEVQGGKLIFSNATTQIADVTVRAGATLQTAGVTTDSVTLYGGASWYTTVASNSYETPVYLMDVFGSGGEVNAITIGSNGKSWVTTKYLNMAGAGTWTAGSGAIFELDNVSLDLSKPRVITNMAGISAGAEIAMYSNWQGGISNLEGKNLVMVEDPDGVFYDAHYELKDGVLYLHLHDTERDYGIVARNEPLAGYTGIEGYIWSGETNGHTVDNDVHYLNMTMGNVWRADGSAHNTGWHEQRAEGSSNDDIGVYENGNTVTFADGNVHAYVDKNTTDTDTVRKVDISGAVAPGKILVTADNNAGRNGSSEAQMEFGYAFVSTDGTGTITDFGNTPTEIIKTGDSILIINTTNSFTGGIDVKDGGLYLAAVGAAGTGTLTFHTDEKWSYDVVNNNGSLGYEMSRTGAELMICYPHSDDALSGFRGSTLTNDFVLTSSDDTQGGNFRLSFAHASFNEKSTNDDHANVPRHWRNVTLSGALVGTGDSRDVLELVGYCSTWTNARDQSYVTSITMNEDTIGAAYKDGAQIKDYNRFNGTVVMKNTVNTSPLDSNELSKRIAGTVQLVLKGEKLSEAHLNMTRESVRQSQWDGSNSNPRQTYNNILVINGNTTLRGLSAKFQGCGWDFAEHWGSDNPGRDRVYVANMKQNDEVWHVRTLTNGLNTLQLGEYKDVDNTTYVYSGAMGFAQAYTGVSQAHVPYGDGFKEHPADGWYFGGHSMASESLNLTKGSSSAQYIHTAKLQDISVYEGVLGFNSLEFSGNMNLVGGSNLKLGVVGAADTTTEGKSKNLQVVAGTGWNYIGSNATSGMSKGELYKVATTTDTATVNTGKTLTVITVAEQADGNPTTAVVDGNLTLAAGATLNFRTNGILPYSADIRKQYSNGSLGSVVTTSSIEGQVESDNPIVTLLTVNGKLTFADANDVSISLTGADFSTTGFYNRKYYLAAADGIVVGSTSNETLFMPRTISLGYGYFGTLYTVGDMGSSLVDKDGNKDTDHAKYRDYLVMTVSGDPRRTWSGMMSTQNVADQSRPYVTERSYTWEFRPNMSEDAYDYRWKENTPFSNAQVVLFGNLYEPLEWGETERLPSDQTVQVKLDTKHQGTLVQDTAEASSHDFNIDGYSVENRTGKDAFQAVKVKGEVAPFTLVINSDYYGYEKDAYGDYIQIGTFEDDTNYYFYADATGGVIRDALPDELNDYGFESTWKTMLHKSGTGTTVMELDNRYTGGSVLQGGRMVMKHVNALGYVYNPSAGDNAAELFPGNDCTITLMNGAELQGDFDDDDFPGNFDAESSTALGKAMDTTTIRNKVVVNVYADPENPGYDSIIDGRIINSYNKKLILRKLQGETDTVLELAGVGKSVGKAAKDAAGHYLRDAAGNYLAADGSIATDGKFHYGVFKVLDPGEFFGKVTMSGHVWGDDSTAAGGMVQLDIMSTAKSSEDADWTNATVDLTVNKGTERTVVALDVMSYGEICELNSITGTVCEGGSSSVLNMSKHNAATLVLTGTRSGDYDGVLGYGDFQVAVNYGGYTEEQQGSTQHHYGAVGHGSLNLIKKGEGSTQAVRRAWLNSLDVQGGIFLAKEALVAHDITAGRGKRVMVGDFKDESSLYALTVGQGGVLAMNTTFAESGKKQDAWAQLEGGTTQGDSNTWVGWVSLENGATLSAREDWYTAKQVDIATGAAVTINTHNFAIDPYISEKNDVFGKYLHSHIIQLLGKVTGQNVTLTLKNQLTDPTRSDADKLDAQGNKVQSGYMGYVALNDINNFTGSSTVNVEEMTVLQLLSGNGGVEADVDVTVAGRHATLQVVDKVVQYVDNLTLGANNLPQPEGISSEDPLHRVNNGQLLLGGKEVTTLVPNSSDYMTEPDKVGERVVISARHDDMQVGLLQADGTVRQQAANSMQGEMSHVHVDMTGTAVKIGGADGHQSVASNVHVDVVDKSSTHSIYNTDFHHSIIHLQEDCSVNISETVLLDYQSTIAGVVHDREAGTVSPEEGPSAATGSDATNRTFEVTTSGKTTVQLTFSDQYQTYEVGDSTILVLQTEQFQGVDITGTGLTIQLYEDPFELARMYDADYVAFMVDGGSGKFLYEEREQHFDALLDSEYTLLNRDGEQLAGYWISSVTVQQETGAAHVSMHMLYFRIPEPTTTTLSLLALTALCARRRRK